jgi:hypothetical protein
MIICGMAKKPRSPPAPPAKRRRGRPPKPGGPIPQAEVQRAHRARLAAAGNVVRLVDAASAHPVLTSIPGFDPATQLICDRKTFKDMRDNLHNALVLAFSMRVLPAGAGQAVEKLCFRAQAVPLLAWLSPPCAVAI